MVYFRKCKNNTSTQNVICLPVKEVKLVKPWEETIPFNNFGSHKLLMDTGLHRADKPDVEDEQPQQKNKTATTKGN